MPCDNNLYPGGSITNTITQETGGSGSIGDVTNTGGSATTGECRNRCSATCGWSGDTNVSTGDVSPSITIGDQTGDSGGTGGTGGTGGVGLP
ncbi:MAG: hypothetical protein M3251_00405 [Thermoproteota archaeon]|nr:hypothetical protein [Thermoproteota archaeon]MDQ3887714.1 hypothetical protein [Thermoproteota archaeon]